MAVAVDEASIHSAVCQVPWFPTPDPKHQTRKTKTSAFQLPNPFTRKLHMHLKILISKPYRPYKPLNHSGPRQHRIAFLKGAPTFPRRSSPHPSWKPCAWRCNPSLGIKLRIATPSSRRWKLKVYVCFSFAGCMEFRDLHLVWYPRPTRTFSSARALGFGLCAGKLAS